MTLNINTVNNRQRKTDLTIDYKSVGIFIYILYSTNYHDNV